MFGGGFKASKCKTLLKLAMARIKLLRNKRDIQIKQMRKDIAQLLQTGQEPSARIRVEHIAREQNIMAAYDILELFCEQLTVRLSIIEAQKQCPLDMKEAVSSLIFAAPRCADLPELIQIRTQFNAKYGKEFVAAAAELRPDCGVNRRIIEKLSVKAPKGELKLKLLTEIADEFKVEWDPTDTEAELLKRPEDLLDGPKEFYGASSAPASGSSFSPSSINESSSFSRRPQDAIPSHPQPPPPPPPPAPSAPIQMMPLDPSSDEDSSSRTRANDKPQFVPFLGPHPSQRAPAADTAPIHSRSTSASVSSTSGKYDSPRSPVSRSETYSEGQKEGRQEFEGSGDYMNVDDAVRAAAEYSRRAAAAANAAAALRKSQSMSSSPPRARRSPRVRASEPVEDSDEESTEEDEPQSHRHQERRRPPGRYTEETPPKHEPKRSDSDKSRDGASKHEPKRSDSDKSRDGASFTRRNIQDANEFSFRTSFRPEQIPKSPTGNSEDRQDASFWRVSSNEGSNRRSKSEEPKDTSASTQTKSDDQPEVFRRNSSGSRGGIFSGRIDEDQEEGSFGKNGSDTRRAQYDVEPPKKVDPEHESFWKPADDGWRSHVDSDVSRKIDAGIFTGRAGEDDSDYAKKSSRDSKYSDAPSIFSRADSAESDLFKRSDSAELDLRSSDEFYDTKQGLPTPKFDDEDHSSSSVSSSRRSTKYEDDPYERSSNYSSGPPLNHFWRSAPPSQDVTEDEVAFVKRFSFANREDLKPLDKSKSDTLSEKDYQTGQSESIDRAGSDPLYNKSFKTREQKLDVSVPTTKSRRTRVIGKDKSEDGEGSFGSPVRRSKTYSSYDENPTTSDEPPYSSRPIPFKPSPSTNSASYQSPETKRESLSPVTLTHSGSGSSLSSPGSVHPKLPDIDDLTARFEALKAAKR
ncbi:hypothetical protein R1sor_006257 [Riccia sorocarpa]|uniref:IST1-like protein n=1 Tax=Riccia sorocarpa TaxID=122646 RepID=A0ABD3HR54_9MARC